MEINMKKLALAVCCVLTIASLAGCGDDDELTVMNEYLQLSPEPIEKETLVASAETVTQESLETKEDSSKESETEEGQLGESQGASVPAETPEPEATETPTSTPEPTPILEPTPTPSNKKTITISATGDVTIGTTHLQSYSGSFRQAYDQADGPEYFFENVYDYFSTDDFTLVNLEGMLTKSDAKFGERSFYIKGDPEYVEILTAGGVDAISMANNHRLDFGEGGSRDTVKVLEEAGIPYAYDDNFTIVDVNGIKIGYVAVNEASKGAGVEKTLKEGIAKLREDGADLVFACCHWGAEGKYTLESYQKTLGHKCIDWGADLVIGHHPHVLQGVEEYQGKYIVYSLGNFCFGANRNPKDKDTMIFQQTFTFENDQLTNETTVRMIPCSLSSVSDKNDFKPTPATGDEATRIIEKMNGMSKDLGVTFGADGYVIPGEKTE